MKSMKSLGGMNRMLGSVRRRANAPTDTSPETTLATPEKNASRSVKLFCQSGGPNHTQGEEVLHLPTIVEAAESSPAAAKECAYQIRKFLSKDNMTQPYLQYNAVMLMRILSDNPGATFTKNIDKKYVETVKELIRMGRDPSVQQILRETLDTFERDKKSDVNLGPLIEMWKKEQIKIAKAYGHGTQLGPRTLETPPGHQNYFSRSHTNNKLPNPDELASRIEEAKTSAKLLTQLVQSTPPTELLHNELIREFADRCQSAGRSIQAYIISEDPTPDNDTMLTLIETNEQLSLATTKHQRAILQIRKTLAVRTPDQGSSPSSVAPLPGPPPTNSNLPAPPVRKPAPTILSGEETRSEDSKSDADAENPFIDPVETSQVAAEPLIDQNEPYHPGFNLTKSYKGQQQNTLGKIKMDDADSLTAYGGRNEAHGSTGEEDDDAYCAPADPKAPIYRY